MVAAQAKGMRVRSAPREAVLAPLAANESAQG
jgi:hypothetical protein